MSGPRLSALRLQFDDLKAGIDNINRAAVERGTDLSEQENADLDALYNRAEALKPQIEAEAAKEQSITAVSEVLARVGATAPSVNRARPAEAPELTAGEYFSAWFRANHEDGDLDRSEFLDRAARYINRADQDTGDTSGLLPTPIIGNVLKFVDARRPVFGSMTSRSMPARGKTFERPRVAQTTQVGEQLTEGSPLASRKMVITSDTVAKRTVGGFLDLSQQDIDWTEPEALDLVISDFAEQYAIWTEDEACSQLVAAATATDTWSTSDVESVVESFMGGILSVYTASKRFPDTGYLSLDVAVDIASLLTTSEDRTAFDVIDEALRKIVPSWRWVVGPEFQANTTIVAASSLVESYEVQKGLLRAVLPSTFSAQIATAGYIGFHIRPEGLCDLVGGS